MSELFDLRIKNKRCQILVKITHDYEAKTQTHMITKEWEDYEKHFCKTHMINGKFDFVSVADALKIEFPDNEVEKEAIA